MASPAETLGSGVIRPREDVEPRPRADPLLAGRVEKGMRMAEDAIRDDYEDKYLGAREATLSSSAEIDDETKHQCFVFFEVLRPRLDEEDPPPRCQA